MPSMAGELELDQILCPFQPKPFCDPVIQGTGSRFKFCKNLKTRLNQNRGTSATAWDFKDCIT